jgi:hypothetical protein
VPSTSSTAPPLSSAPTATSVVAAPASPPASTPSPASPASTATPAPATAQPNARPGDVPERFWDATKGALNTAELNRLAADVAAETSRKASVPAADKYELKFNDGYQLPVGVEWTWDTTDQGLITEARQYAHENGISQEGFGRLLGMYAASRISENQAYATAQAAEIAKLGVNAPTRVDAIGTWLEAQVGGDLAKALRSSLYTAKQVEGFEKLIRAFVSQGVGGNPSGGRDATHGREPQRLSDADYAKLTFGEKEQYARQFDQSRFANGRG